MEYMYCLQHTHQRHTELCSICNTLELCVYALYVKHTALFSICIHVQKKNARTSATQSFAIVFAEAKKKEKNTHTPAPHRAL